MEVNECVCYLRQRGYVVSHVCVFVCLFVCLVGLSLLVVCVFVTRKKTTEHISTKFGPGPRIEPGYLLVGIQTKGGSRNSISLSSNVRFFFVFVFCFLFVAIFVTSWGNDTQILKHI